MMWRAVPLVMLCVLTAACGQRGDLYIPSEVREPVVTVPARDLTPPAQPADEEDDTNAVQPPATGNPGSDTGTR